MTELQAAVGRVRAALATAEAAKEEAREILRDLTAKILAGESTGNPTQDYLISAFGVTDESAQARYDREIFGLAAPDGNHAGNYI